MANETNILDTDGNGKVTKHDIIHKLTSRKFWMSLATLVFMIMVYCGASEGSATQVVAIIMAAATVVGYVLGEGLADQGGVAGGDVIVPGVTYPEYGVDEAKYGVDETAKSDVQ